MGDMNSQECFKLWRIWTTSKQMCHDRGYLVLPEDLELSFDSWKERFGDRPKDGHPKRDELNFVVGHNDNEMDRLFVFFPHEKNVSGDDVKSFYKRMEEGSIYRSIIVYEAKITPIAKSFIDALKTQSAELGRTYIMEIFRAKELMINVTKHTLVPKHIVLNNEEKQVLLGRYRLKETELARIQCDDPVTRYYGLVVGQVFKIVRSSATAGRYVSYRIVA